MQDSVRRSTQRFRRCHVTRNGLPPRLNKACMYSGAERPPTSRVAPHMSALHGYHGYSGYPLASSSQQESKSATRDTGPCGIRGNTHSAAVVRIRIPTAASEMAQLFLCLALVFFAVCISTVKPLTTQHRRIDTLIRPGRLLSAV